MIRTLTALTVTYRWSISPNVAPGKCIKHRVNGVGFVRELVIPVLYKEDMNLEIGYILIEPLTPEGSIPDFHYHEN